MPNWKKIPTTSADVLTLIEDGVDSVHYVDASIDHVHLAADIIDGDNIANDVIDSEHYVAASIDNEHLANNAVNTDEIADNAVTEDKLADTLLAEIDANTLKNTNVVGNLGVVANGTSLTITTANGSNISIPVATTSAWGAMSDDLVSAIVANTAKETNEETVDGTVDAKGKLQLATNEEAVEGASTSKVLTPRAAVGLVTAKKVHDLTAPSAAFAMNSQKITGVANPTANQDAATKAYVDAQAGQTVVLGSASGLINRTAAQFASDGTDQVYIGSNNYGWNDARDWATQIVDIGTPVLNQNDQMCGIICPISVSQVTIKSQVRMNSANGNMMVKVYKMNRATAVTDNDLALSIIAAGASNTLNGRFTTIDITGTTAVAAGQLIIVGFGKTDGGNGQKPRFNFTLTGTIA